MSKSKSSGCLSCVSGCFAKIFAGGLIIGLVGFVGVYLYYDARANFIDIAVVKNMPKASILYDIHGIGFSRFFSENRISMPTDKPVPKLLIEAVIDKEDRRFFHHGGIDPLGMIRAGFANLFHIGAREGGSTITQQLARNSIGMMQRTYDRKILEIFLANRIEHAYSKDEILRYYLDRIYFGQGLYGVETTSYAFFGCSVEQLNLSQCALLAGMISSPNASSPWKDMHAAKAARLRALAEMVRAGDITQAQADHANKQPLVLRPRPNYNGGSATAETRRQLEQVLDPEVVELGGLKVFTTIDWNLQQAAEHAVADRVKEIEISKGQYHTQGLIDPQTGEPYDGLLQGAFIAIDPTYGAIRAVVGSRDFSVSPYNRAMQSRRQVGSTLKPLIYAVAFAEKDYNPASSIENTPFDLRLNNPATVTGDHTFLRVNDALVKSDNYAAVRMGEIVGPNLLNSYAKACGVTTDLPPYASTYLGACEMSLSELTGIYATLANQGVNVGQHIIIKVTDSQDHVLYEYKPSAKRIFSPQVARQVTGMMENVLDYGTGASVRQDFHFQAPAAGKTGTTNDYKDCWFEGYTTHLAAGAWVGYDKPKEIMPGGYAAKVALPIWTKVMLSAQSHYAMEPFPVPEGLQATTIGRNWLGQDGEVYYLTDQQKTALDQNNPTDPAPSPRSGRNLLDRFFDLFK